MVNKKHKPPSRERYEEENPVISVRFDKETAKRIKNLSDFWGKSLATIIKEALDEEEDEQVEAYTLGWETAKKDYHLWYYCAVCGNKILIEPDSDDHKAIIQFFRENGWAHQSCLFR